MKQYVQIKEIKSQEGETLYKVGAILLQSKDGGQQKKIPHPSGTETMLFKTLDKAKEAVALSGFEYILPDGSIKSENAKTEYKLEPYEKKILDALVVNSKDANPNIVAAAISAMSEVNHPDCLKIYINKLGEDNDLIRQNSIDAILKYGVRAIPDILSVLNSENWVQRNSAVICLQNFCETKEFEVAPVIDALLAKLQDNNPIVKCSVLRALGSAYKMYKSK